MWVVGLKWPSRGWVLFGLGLALLLWYGLSRPPVTEQVLAPTPAQTAAVWAARPASQSAAAPGGTGGIAGAQARPDFAAEASLAREQSRSARLETLRQLAADTQASPLTRDEAQRRLLTELDRAAKEEELTRLLVAEGFADPLVVLNDHGVTVSVAGRLAGVTAAARIGELAARMTGLTPDRVVIMDGR